MIVFVFLLGLVIGSFLNVCIYRIPRKESIVFPASHCTKCDHPLKWYDLVPVFSFLFLRGKCRYCKEKITPRYALVELLNGIMYMILFYFFNLSIDFIFYAIITSVLIIITFIDLEHMEIPNVLVLILLITSIVHKGINYFIFDIDFKLLSSILGLLVSSILFLLIIVVSKGGMGGGDMTLIGALGFILGFKKIILTIALSFLLGAIISVFLLLSRIKSRKDPIPFGPFIILGFFITLFWGDLMISWYINTFFI